MNNVIDLADRPEMVGKRFRRVAEKSEDIVIPHPPGETGDWQKIVNLRQIILCIQKGDIYEEPYRNDNGDWECRFERFSAGVCIRLTAVLFRHNNNWRIYVTRVERKT